MADQFHLWRQYSTAPYLRFACTVEQADTPDGFRIVDYDVNVADLHFLHTMQTTMRSHVIVRDSVEKDGVIAEGMSYEGPDYPEHFETAIRMVPDAFLRGEGRP